MPTTNAQQPTLQTAPLASGSAADSPEALARRESLTAIGRVLAFAVIALAIVRLAPAISFDQIHNDFSHYYIGGWLLANGQNVYTTSLEPYCAQMGIAYDATIPHAAHPPLILAWFSLFSVFPMKIAYGLWLACQLACAVGFVEITRRILSFRWADPFWILIVGAYCNSLSFQLLFYYSQVQLAVGILIYAAIFADQKQRHTAACCLIAVASAVKIYPVILAPWFFFRKLSSFRDAATRVGAMALTSAGCLALPGLGTWRDFVVLGVPTLADNATKWCNYSLQNLVCMLSKAQQVGSGIALGEIETPKTTASILAAIAVAACYVVAFKIRRQPTAAISVLLCVMMFGGIITWSHYLTVLLLPLALLLKTARCANNIPAQITVLCLSVLLLTPKIDFGFFEAFQWSNLRILAHFYPLYVAAAVVALLARNANVQPAGRTERQPRQLGGVACSGR